MDNITLTKEKLDLIRKKCDEHENKTGDDVKVEDVLYTALNPGYVLNDWDEGEANDPFWDKENDCHSAITFIKETINLL